MNVVQQLIERYPALAPQEANVIAAGELLIERFAAGGRLLVCGNGGSAADSEHIVGELMKGFRSRRPLSSESRDRLMAVDSEDGRLLAEKLQGALPAIALTGSFALATAFANDVDPNLVFAQQVYGYGRQGDVLLALSTSGNSRNVALAAICAKALGLAVIAMTGPPESRLSELADITIAVSGGETLEIQELHLPVYHALCLILEERFFPS